MKDYLWFYSIQTSDMIKPFTAGSFPSFPFLAKIQGFSCAVSMTILMLCLLEF